MAGAVVVCNGRHTSAGAMVDTRVREQWSTTRTCVDGLRRVTQGYAGSIGLCPGYGRVMPGLWTGYGRVMDGLRPGYVGPGDARARTSTCPASRSWNSA